MDGLDFLKLTVPSILPHEHPWFSIFMLIIPLSSTVNEVRIPIFFLLPVVTFDYSDEKMPEARFLDIALLSGFVERTILKKITVLPEPLL